MKETIKKLNKAIWFQEDRIRDIPEVKKRRKVILKAQREIEKLIEECPHKNSFAMYDGNTGGYDGPNSDIYWVNVYCCDCEKHFHFDANEKGYDSRNWGRTLSKWNEEDKKLIKKYHL